MQHSKKTKGSARGNWDPREGQQPFRPNPNGARDRTTTLRRLLIGAETGEFVNFFRFFDPTFPFLSRRPGVAEPEATSLSSVEPRTLWSLTCPFALHSPPPNSFRTASNLSSSTANGPDKVAYPMLKHLPRSGMDFLLHIFNLSWSSHSFPSIIPIHKMGKPLDSSAFFRPISLTSCVSNLFERIILSGLLFFPESNSILSPRQAGFRPEQSTLDQILYLSQSISDWFNKPRPDSRTILSTIDFSKAFDCLASRPFL